MTRAGRFVLPALVIVATNLAVSASTTRHAGAATRPDRWCGSDEVAADRTDVVAGNQVHVVYAHPRDSPSRFGEVIDAIARDLAGVDTWWRSQDPTRTPRFDLASFAGCTSEFGALDISSTALDLDRIDVSGQDTSYRLGSALATAGYNDKAKKYLVYFDGPGPERTCGVTQGDPNSGGAFFASYVFLRAPDCSLGGGLGSGNGWPAVTAVHELIHGLNGRFTPGTAPHQCADRAHVCDSGLDVLAPGSSHVSPLLSDGVLDVGRDDYYGHGGSWWDVRDSAWLMHLEHPPGVVSVTVNGTGGGGVSLDPFGAVCAHVCSLRYDGGTAVRIIEIAPAGFQLILWGGACSGSADICTVTAGGDVVNVTATFGRAATMRVRAVGPGSTADSKGSECFEDCRWDLVPGSQLAIVARPDHGARFVGWRGLCTGTARTCLVTVTLNTRKPEIRAIFRRSKQPPRARHRGTSIPRTTASAT